MGAREIGGDGAADAAAGARDDRGAQILTGVSTVKVSLVSDGMRTCWPLVNTSAPAPTPAPAPAPMAAPLPPPAIAPMMAPTAAPPPTFSAVFLPRAAPCLLHWSVMMRYDLPAKLTLVSCNARSEAPA